MRHLCPTLLLVLTLMLVACQRDDTDDKRWVEVTAESYDGAKVALDGNSATWVDGEQVRINGTVATITRIDGHAYIDASAVNAAGTNRALYPATLGGSALTSDAATISLPAEYLYSTSGGLQHIELPMAARSEGQRPLLFQHLTGALTFTIVNSLGQEIVLDRLTVKSDRYSLSGSRNIDFGAIDATAPAAPAQAADSTVALVFDRQRLAAGDSLRVTLPIAPVGADNHFTVTLSAHHEGTRYTFSRTQPHGGALARSQRGYAKAVLSSSSTTNGPLFNKIGYPFAISTPQEFDLMVEAINSGWSYSGKEYKSQEYILTNDIDMSGRPINPISGFSGSDFDGGNHTVSNLTINSTSKNCALFNSIGNRTVKNLTLENTTLNSSGTEEVRLSPLVGEATKNIKIINCTINSVNTYISGNPTYVYFGGLTGYSTSDTIKISSCSVTCSPNITNSHGYVYFGGTAGRLSVATITDCSFNTLGTYLTASSNIFFGGISGYASNGVIVYNSSWEGNNINLDASGTIRVGGLIGRNLSSRIKIKSCSLRGDINTYNSSSIKKGKYIGQASVGQTFDSTSCNVAITVNNMAVTNDYEN